MCCLFAHNFGRTQAFTSLHSSVFQLIFLLKMEPFEALRLLSDPYALIQKLILFQMNRNIIWMTKNTKTQVYLTERGEVCQ